MLDGGSLGENAERKYIGAAIAPSGALFVATSAIVLVDKGGWSQPRFRIRWVRPFQRADLRPSQISQLFLMIFHRGIHRFAVLVVILRGAMKGVDDAAGSRSLLGRTTAAGGETCELQPYITEVEVVQGHVNTQTNGRLKLAH